MESHQEPIAIIRLLVMAATVQTLRRPTAEAKTWYGRIRDLRPDASTLRKALRCRAVTNNVHREKAGKGARELRLRVDKGGHRLRVIVLANEVVDDRVLTHPAASNQR